MSLTALRRTAAPVAVLAVTAAGLAVAPVLQADASTRAATSVSIRTAHPAVRPGGTDTITGHLGIAGSLSPAGRTVTLEARPMGADSFTPIGDATAGARGGLRESVMPDVTTRYRWHYAGDTDTRPSVSGVATIRVRTPQHPAQRIPTSLSIRATHHVVAPQRFGRRAGTAARASYPAPAPHRDPRVTHRRQRPLDVRGRPPHRPTRRDRLPGQAPGGHGVPPGLPRDAAPTARAQCGRPHRHPARPDHLRRPDPHRARRDHDDLRCRQRRGHADRRSDGEAARPQGRRRIG